MKNYNSGFKKQNDGRTKKEDVSIEMYGIARDKPGNHTDAYIQERVNDIRKERRYKEAFGEGSSSQQSEAISSGLENKQHDSSEQPKQESLVKKKTWNQWQDEKYGSESWDHNLNLKD